MEQYFRTRVSVDDEPDLASNRRANDARLKSRFEHIFAKYGKDFGDVGDEIDLDTGEIVVNNGHLESMRHEVDPGKSVSSQVLQVLGGSAHTKSKDTIPTVGFVDESSTEDSDDEEGASVAESSESSSGNDNIDEDDNQRFRGAPPAPDARLSEDDEPRDGPEPRSEQRYMVSREQKTGASGDEQNIDRTTQSTSRGRSPGSAPMDLSFLQNSMETAMVKPGQGESIDPNVIQALGQSIANQLAKFMSNPSKKRKSESSGRRKTNDSRWEYPVLPGDRTARTPSPPPPASSSAALFARSPDDDVSIWAAERPRRPKRQRTSLRITEAVDPARDEELLAPAPRKKVTEAVESAAGDVERDEEPQAEEPQAEEPHAPAPRKNSTKDNETTGRKICSHCGDTESRKWRISPAGSYLCNACGTYFFSFGKSRPFGVSKSTRKPHSSQASPASSHTQRPAVEGFDVFSIPLTSTPGTNGYTANTARRMTGYAKGASERPAHPERVYSDTPTRTQVGSASPTQGTSVRSASCEIPSIRKPRFSESEKQILIRLREGNMEWTQIASYLPGRTLNSLKAMDRRLTLAQGSSVSDDDETLQPGQSPFTTEDDELIVLMRDQEGMPFAEMVQYFRGRAEADLVLRYKHLKDTRPNSARGEHASVDVPPSHTLGRPGLSGPSLRQDKRHKSVASLEPAESHITMPPPPLPASQRTRVDVTPVPVASVQDSDQGSAPVAHEHGPLPPQTPSFPIPSLSQPPRPLEVGPSAWTATQPTSKGPLPFKPARRSLIPLVPRGHPYTIADPFVSDRHAAGDKQTSRSEDITSYTQHRPSRHAKDRARANLKDLYEAFPTNDESTSTSSPSQHHEGLTAAVATQGSLAKETRGTTAIPVPAEESKESPSPGTRIRAHTTNTTPETKRRVPYSDEQSKLIKRLKEQGQSYSKIAAQIGGGRTAISIQNHYYYTYTSTVPTSRAQSSHTTAKRTPLSPPLLRQALGNSRRRSSAGTDVELLAIDTARKFLQEHESKPVGTDTDDLPHRTEAQDEDRTMQDDEPHTSQEGSVSSDADSDDQSGRPNVHAMFQAFDDKMASPDGRSTKSRRRDSSPRVYIDNTVRIEDNLDEFRLPRAFESDAAAAPVKSGASCDRLHEREASSSPPHEDRPISGKAPSEPSVESNKNLGEEVDTGLALDNDELPDYPTHEVETSQHTKALPQKGTKRKRSPARSKRASDFEVADSDSDAVPDPSSQGKANDHEVEEEQIPTPPVAVAPAKRGRGRPRRTPLTAPAPEVITISSDPPIKPELASEGNAITTQPMKRSDKTQQLTPRSKASRYSDSALIQRPSNSMATPARSGDGNVDFLSRSGTSSLPNKRFESLSRTGPRESPVTRDPSGSTRRIILATAAGANGDNEELDELS
jgi:hypothetical protein